MTLNVTSDKIQIKNTDGTIKFTSDNKLVYLKYFTTGTITLYNATVKVPFYSLGAQDFLIVNVMINSSTGNVNGNTGLNSSYIPANGSVLIDVNGRANGNSGICDVEYMGIQSIGDSLTFNSLRYDYNGYITKGICQTNLTYVAAIYGYL